MIEYKKIRCSWDLCKYNTNYECNNIEQTNALKDGKIKITNDPTRSMTRCKLYSRKYI